MILPKARVILIDKDRMRKELECVLIAQENINSTLKKLRWHEDICFDNIELSLRLSHEIILYLKSLSSYREDKRDRAIDDIIQLLDTINKD